MNITQILETKNKTLSPAAKIKAIKAIIKTARKNYGNTDIEITACAVNTCNGSQAIKYLSNKDKLGLVESEIASIRNLAIIAVSCTSGVVFDKKVEELLACSPLLCNLGKEVKSTYL